MSEFNEKMDEEVSLLSLLLAETINKWEDEIGERPRPKDFADDPKSWHLTIVMNSFALSLGIMLADVPPPDRAKVLYGLVCIIKEAMEIADKKEGKHE